MDGLAQFMHKICVARCPWYLKQLSTKRKICVAGVRGLSNNCVLVSD